MPEGEPHDRPPLAATGHAGRGGGRHEQLDHDPGDLEVDEHRALEREQDEADRDDPHQRTLDECRQHVRYDSPTSDSGL